MAGVLNKLLRKSSSLRIITSFNNSQPPTLAASLFLSQQLLSKSKPDDSSNLNPLLGSLNKEKISFSHPLQIYSCFPFGYCLNPISPTGFDQSRSEEAQDMGSGESQTVWADSVKKKRKKKMNKHKYNKLRKRLRRQT
ncbi:hypothetical protein HHK36_029521 [Tetracentron sinense]|uniref:Small ribosomal subunit protein mS38 n=1 Tax=Tetracentron sinense TaxID=13715 RepID=A0A834YBG2_TETSI|nr:hypothetical protein HHK36_029521 [Tetracentron sinense]